MSLCSKIDRVVRHHIHDRWFYDSQPSAEPSEFHWEEEAISMATSAFNARHYSSEPVSDFDKLLAVKSVFDAGWVREQTFN